MTTNNPLLILSFLLFSMEISSELSQFFTPLILLLLFQLFLNTLRYCYFCVSSLSIFHTILFWLPPSFNITPTGITLTNIKRLFNRNQNQNSLLLSSLPRWKDVVSNGYRWLTVFPCDSQFDLLFTQMTFDLHHTKFGTTCQTWDPSKCLLILCLQVCSFTSDNFSWSLTSTNTFCNLKSTSASAL